ncbi:exodeoxyribonuclease VII large subunit [Anaerotignum faecicola]|nr:exodeoxyribonuclease VII large subunit [Anaerotignum faecicola]
MIEPRVFSVTQINRYIRELIEKDFILQSLWIKGEISNYKRHSSGHLYFTLKDGESAINCIMFRGNAQMLPFEPENGMEAVVCGYISIYEKTGQYQFYGELIQPVGIGALTAAYDRLKNKLEKEGLFDGDFKREICSKPETVAVITSPTGAAVRDIINIAKRRNKSVRIVVAPVLVQGENAAASIVNALKAVNNWGGADTIILGRGGGSIEDLWAFNEESVARAIFASDIPVISAVGHETDFTISDFVADLRAPTPSAAAELAVNDVEGDLAVLNSVRQRLNFAMKKYIADNKSYVLSVSKNRAFKRVYENLANNSILLDKCKKSMDKAVLNNFSAKKELFKHSVERLELLSPLGTLKRGYSIAFSENGKLISSVKSIKQGEKISVRVTDGEIYATVMERIESNG